MEASYNRPYCEALCQELQDEVRWHETLEENGAGFSDYFQFMPQTASRNFPYTHVIPEACTQELSCGIRGPSG